jgi:hypothetical protein
MCGRYAECKSLLGAKSCDMDQCSGQGWADTIGRASDLSTVQVSPVKGHGVQKTADLSRLTVKQG